MSRGRLGCAVVSTRLSRGRVGVGISRRGVLVHRTHELGRGFGETREQLFAHHLRLLEIAGRFAEHRNRCTEPIFMATWPAFVSAA
jgi:hypothetical protein